MTIRVRHTGSASEAVAKELPQLISDKVASRLFAKDHTLWGKEAEAESAIRLGWVDAASNSLPLIPEVEALRDSLHAKGISRIVLCGMGGSSLAPEVITATAGVELVVLDSTDPAQVIAAVNTDLAKTAVVVSSKSGSTVETDSQKQTFEAAFTTAGIEKTERIVIVTDPGSPMEEQAKKDGYRIFNADPTVGGRYSALTAFGVVPSVLAGVNMTPILQSAIESVAVLSQDSESNPGLVLGALLARTANGSVFKDKIGFVPDGSPITGFGDWLEQLIAESTGKIDRGILPIALESNSYEVSKDMADVLLVGLSSAADESELPVAVSGELGEQLMLWEVATVVASRLLGINPFDQPDVESAKIAARAMLQAPADESNFGIEQDGLAISSSGLGLQSDSTLAQALSALIDSASSDSYFSIQAYLDRGSYAKAIEIRELLAQKTDRPVTFGWGPRFLHSTGQYHKGGPKQGIFLQLTQDEDIDLAVSGRDFTFKQLITSQAAGDARVLADTGRPVLSIRLRDPQAGIEKVKSLLS